MLYILLTCREKGLNISASPSPTEEIRADDMPASTTLASILKTLKHVEHNCKGELQSCLVVVVDAAGWNGPRRDSASEHYFTYNAISNISKTSTFQPCFFRRPALYFNLISHLDRSVAMWEAVCILI